MRRHVILLALCATFCTSVRAAFIRGDSDSDGRLSLTDVINTVGYLFRGHQTVPPGQVACADAADANDDGLVNLADPIWSLNFLFRSGSPMPAPYPEYGEDPTEDGLSCDDPAETCENPVGSLMPILIGDLPDVTRAESVTVNGRTLTASREAARAG